MLVLLPPSESKAAPARRGRPVDLAGLSFPTLTPMRLQMLAALAAASAAPDALRRLGVGPSLTAEVDRNRRLLELPGTAAGALYTGVLYDALGWATLDPAARRRGGDRLIVISALWGRRAPATGWPPTGSR